LKREALLRQLRRYARKNGLSLEVDARRGAGSHYIVRLGDKWTTVQSGELEPFKVGRICGQLGIDPASL